MERLQTACCGLDIHKRTVVACMLRPAADEQGQSAKELRTFATTAEAARTLRDWLVAAGCTHVAMEATGVYWKALYRTLEGSCTVWLVNAQHIKQVPGRKTDALDAEWLAELVQHGLLRPSFVPDAAQRALRDLTRTRTALIEQRTALINRIQAVLEDAQIKLAGVASDIMGVSGRDILAALLAGSTDAAAMADLARGKLRQKREALKQALQGRLAGHHRLLIALHLEQVDLLDEQIERLSAEIAARLRPHEAVLVRLETIPGVGRRTAEILVAEVGVEVSRFPTAGHLASWAGMCPGQHESAGKRKGGPRRHGNRAVRRVLTEAAKAAARTKKPQQTYLRGRYWRLAARCGKKRAAVAVGHTILRIVYHVLATGEPYREPVLLAIDERRRAHVQHRAVAQLAALGYEVTLTPTRPAA
jgi:transposase